MNPLFPLVKKFEYKPWGTETEQQIKKAILDLEIQGLVDVTITNTGDSEVRVTPVFATEQDYMWFILKYVNTL